MVTKLWFPELCKISEGKTKFQVSNNTRLIRPRRLLNFETVMAGAY